MTSIKSTIVVICWPDLGHEIFKKDNDIDRLMNREAQKLTESYV